MRVAALYDIHGNLPALEAVLTEIEQSNIDEIVVGGDVVLGPMSAECIDRLSNIKIPIHFIYGNCEIAVLNQMNEKPEPKLPETVLEDLRWTANSLSPKHKRMMSRWSMTLSLAIEGLGDVMFCHATPYNENDNFTKLTPTEKLIPVFESVNADVVVCGHTHMQFDRMIGTTRVINAGSIGMPFGIPGAYWIILGSSIALKFTEYDLTDAAEKIENTYYPHAEDFAKSNVLNPPEEDFMLELFAKSEPHKFIG